MDVALESAHNTGMTYVVAGQSHGCGFVLADSAITTRFRSDAGDDPIDYTSMGERIFDDGTVLVHEAALKIYRHDKTAISFAGNARRGRELTQRVLDSLDQNGDLEQTLRALAQRPCARDVALVAVTSEHLWTLCDGELQLRLDPVQIGFSEGPYQRGLTKALLRCLSRPEMSQMAPTQRLAMLVCTSQSFGMSDYIVSTGVGGAFAGALVTNLSFTWMPQILYFVPSSPPLLTLVGVIDDHCIACPMGTSNAIPRAFANLRDNEQVDIERMHRAYVKLVDTAATLTFDYVCSIHPTISNVAVIEMNRQQYYKHLRLTHLGAQGERHDVRIDVSDYLANRMRHRLIMRSGVPAEVTVGFLGYCAPDTHSLESPFARSMT